MTRREITAAAHGRKHLRLMLAYHDAPKGDRRRRLRELRAYMTAGLEAMR